MGGSTHVFRLPASHDLYPDPATLDPATLDPATLDPAVKARQ